MWTAAAQRRLRMSLLPTPSASPRSKPRVRAATPRRSTAAAVAGRAVQAVVATYLLAIVAAGVLYKAALLGPLTADPFFAGYGLVVTAYLVSRFALSLPYRAPRCAGIE